MRLVFRCSNPLRAGLLGPSTMVLVIALGAGACGGTHAGVAPTTRVLRTSLHDDGSTVARLEDAVRAQGCVLRGIAEPTTRVLATCDAVDVLFAAGPWDGLLSVQCAETNTEATCNALVERIASAAMSAPDVASAGDAR